MFKVCRNFNASNSRVFDFGPGAPHRLSFSEAGTLDAVVRIRKHVEYLPIEIQFVTSEEFHRKLKL